MKKIKSIFLMTACLSVAGLTSCGDDFLDVTPKGSLAAGTSQSETQAQSMLLGCYDGYQTIYGYDFSNFLMVSEIMSDNCFAGGGTGDSKNNMAIDRFDKSYADNESMLESYWKKYYMAINRCNTLISSEATTAWSSDETRNSIIGQARAVRALCYFDLVRMFGSVPLLTSPSIAKVPQAEPAEIFELIAEDFKFAAENIKFGRYDYSLWGSSYKGLISEWAAKALLARTYLFYKGYYGAELEAVTEAEVRDGLQDIIDNGGFELLDNYADLWPAASRTASAEGHTWATDTYAGENNKEVIFAVAFDSNSDQNNSDVDGFSVSSNNNGSVCMMSMRSVYKAPYGKGWGVCTVNPKLFLAYGEDGADTRRKASIIDCVGEGIEASDGFKDVTDWREYTGYVEKKYTALCYADGTDNVQVENPAGDFQYYQGQDMIVVRYADVLLMAAEMGCAGAQSYYDQVRDRAFGDQSHRKTLTADNILEERRLEFAFEGLRYWDLLRTKGLEGAAAILAANQKDISVKDGAADATVNVEAQNIINMKGLLQKPQNQITLMGTDYLTQNPGW